MKLFTYVIVMLMTAMPLACRAQVHYDFYHRVLPGQIANVSMSQMSSNSVDVKACTLLEKRRYAEAETLFAQKLAKDPRDLIAFIGLAQSAPTRWAEESRRLQQELTRNPQDNTVRFKLATLYFYQGEQRVAEAPKFYEDTEYQKLNASAKKMLEDLWQRQKTVFVGLMLSDLIECRHPDGLTTRKLMEALIPVLGGSTVGKAYTLAKGANWRMDTPPVQLVAPDNRMALSIVLLKLKNMAGSQVIHTTSHTDPVTHNVMTTATYTEPLTPEQQARIQFLDAWSKALRQSSPTTSS